MTNYIFFWKPNEPNGIYCQWYGAEFVEVLENGATIRFKHAEQYMMYYKAMLFGDTKTAASILKTSDPAKAKALGRKVRNFVESEWKKHRLQIVIKGNYLKFSQNEDLRNELLSNDDNTIFAEASPKDAIWGIGFHAAQAMNNTDSWGLNLLGKAIGEVYKMLKNTDE